MGAARIYVGSGRYVGGEERALVVAEIGQNHNGSLQAAIELVDAAAWAGADAVKFVKRDLECELSADARRRRYDSPHAFGGTYGEHRQALELSPDDHAALRTRARRHGLSYFATACDVPSARLLETLGVDCLKIASRDLANLPLLEHVAARGGPVFLSTGMSDLAEIDEAVERFEQRQAPFGLLLCTSLYPTPLEHVHLRSMATLAGRYCVPVGFSDHSQGGLLAPVAVALGAVLIEKHFTLDRRQKGSDHACSLEPEELRQMIVHVRQVESALGRADKPVPSAVAGVRARLGRSLVTRVPLPAGARLDESMLALKCPGDGLAWQERSRVVGRTLNRDIAADEKLTLDDFT